MNDYYVRFFKDGTVVAAETVYSCSYDDAVNDADLKLALHNPDLDYDDYDVIRTDCFL